MNRPLNFPFAEVSATADRLAKAGGLCYQKFSCGKCGNRLTMETPNVFYKTGTCDKCGHVTNIEETGCNYLLAGIATPELLAALDG